VVARFRINEAADLLGVSPDTVRRWADSGRLVAHRDEHGHRGVEGADLADFVRHEGQVTAAGEPAVSSARNRFRGLVTAILKDSVMAQVEIQAGPHRMVSLMSREAVDELGLVVGSVAYAVIKSTNVVVELPRG
jgi:molybdopterin-binding protein